MRPEREAGLAFRKLADRRVERLHPIAEMQNVGIDEIGNFGLVGFGGETIEALAKGQNNLGQIGSGEAAVEFRKSRPTCIIDHMIDQGRLFPPAALHIVRSVDLQRR